MKMEVPTCSKTISISKEAGKKWVHLCCYINWVSGSPFSVATLYPRTSSPLFPALFTMVTLPQASFRWLQIEMTT
jgi:hypothetical protein